MIWIALACLGVPIWFVLGALALLAGIYMLAQPDVALGTLTLFLAAYCFVSGVVEAIYAFQVKPVPGWSWLLFGGIVSLLLGVMIWQRRCRALRS